MVTSRTRRLPFGLKGRGQLGQARRDRQAEINELAIRGDNALQRMPTLTHRQGHAKARLRNSDSGIRDSSGSPPKSRHARAEKGLRTLSPGSRAESSRPSTFTERHLNLTGYPGHSRRPAPTGGGNPRCRSQRRAEFSACAPATDDRTGEHHQVRETGFPRRFVSGSGSGLQGAWSRRSGRGCGVLAATS